MRSESSALGKSRRMAFTYFRAAQTGLRRSTSAQGPCAKVLIEFALDILHVEALRAMQALPVPGKAPGFVMQRGCFERVTQITSWGFCDRIDAQFPLHPRINVRPRWRYCSSGQLQFVPSCIERAAMRSADHIMGSHTVGPKHS